MLTNRMLQKDCKVVVCGSSRPDGDSINRVDSTEREGASHDWDGWLENRFQSRSQGCEHGQGKMKGKKYWGLVPI
jgi:hypothetical protein